MNDVVWLPTDPPRPAPELLTDEEAACYLRIDAKHPKRTLEGYRNKGRLKGVRIGGRILYTIQALQEFVRMQQEEVR